MKSEGFIRRHKKFTVFVLIVLFPSLGIASHEFAVRYFQDKTCVVCHEMKDPIDKWKKSGTATNHNNCAGCHFDAGIQGMIEMNKTAIKLVILHFQRDPNEPIKPREEPLFLEEGLEPGYWSHVPNSRCFQCKDAKDHKEIDQPRIHKKLIKGIASQPCKDCHNHEMRKGQKFYEKVITSADTPAT